MTIIPDYTPQFKAQLQAVLVASPRTEDALAATFQSLAGGSPWIGNGRVVSVFVFGTPFSLTVEGYSDHIRKVHYITITGIQ